MIHSVLLRRAVPEVESDCALPDDLIPSTQAAVILHFTQSGFMAMLRRTGRIPIYHVGRKSMVRRSDLEKLIDRAVKPWARAGGER